MDTKDLLRQRVLEARCAEATEACYVYEIQDDPDQLIGGHDAVLDLTAAKELESQASTIARLTAERDKWHDRYFREVHGQNNEGDLISGVPSGLLHEVSRLTAEVERLTKYNEELFGYCEKIGGMGPGIQPPLDIVDEQKPRALAARPSSEVGGG